MTAKIKIDTMTAKEQNYDVLLHGGQPPMYDDRYQ